MMDEILKCKCGETTWLVLTDRVRCPKCKQEVSLVILEDIKKLNEYLKKMAEEGG